MSDLPFHKFLEAVRVGSNWPTVGDFARQVGLSHSGYKKYERGVRIPSKEALDCIVRQAMLGEQKNQELQRLWNKARAEQVGVVVEGPAEANSEEFANRVYAEVLYVLKQAGILHTVSVKTREVLSARIHMIASAVSEKK
jgi:transcriptional regulator with XRE-family HTH domain